jgi:glycerol-3-phosphate dehydrogenase
MGRCQGGFCRPRLIEILSRELNIPYEDVVKTGEETNFLVAKTKEIVLRSLEGGSEE